MRKHLIEPAAPCSPARPTLQSCPSARLPGARSRALVPKSALTTASKLLLKLELGYTLLTASPSGAGMDRDEGRLGNRTGHGVAGGLGARDRSPPTLNTVLLMESRGVKW